MSKTKKVADEAKTRIKHVFTRDAGIHEGIYRDEPGWFNSNYHAYSFGYGYFFTGGEHIGKRLTPDYIKENWNELVWRGGLQGRCIAYIDRRRKIAVINRNFEYAYSIKYALPYGYDSYIINEDIPCLEPTTSKNRMLLVKAYIRTLIKDYLDTFSHEYRIAVGGSKCKYCPNNAVQTRAKLFEEIKRVYESNKRLPYNKPLQTKYKVCDETEIVFPSINQVLNNTIFTEEQKHLLHKCQFYTRYCFRKGISWAETNKNYDNDEWQRKVITNENNSIIAFQNKVNRLKKEVVDELLNNNKYINDWRNGNTSQLKIPCDIYSNFNTRVIKKVKFYTLRRLFANVQLRLKPHKTNWVETSRSAIVPLAKAIELFNYLYSNYIVNGCQNKVFEENHYINKFKLTSLSYCEKTDDVYNTSLGYYEYKFIIGCHTLWFDDIKNFAKYYNLQKYLVFPVDKSTDECITNHLINNNIENYE